MTYVLVTPKMAYHSSLALSGVKITDADFSAEITDGGTFRIAAKSGVSIKTDSRRSVPVTLTMTDGSALNMTVLVKLVNRVSKVKVSPASLTFGISDTASQNLSVEKTGSLKTQYGEISSVTLDSVMTIARVSGSTYTSADLFSYADGGLTIKNASALKQKKTYTLRLRVKFADQAENAADTVVKVRIKIK